MAIAEPEAGGFRCPQPRRAGGTPISIPQTSPKGVDWRPTITAGDPLCDQVGRRRTKGIMFRLRRATKQPELCPADQPWPTGWQEPLAEVRHKASWPLSFLPDGKTQVACVRERIGPVAIDTC